MIDLYYWPTPNGALRRWFDAIAARPAARRANALKDRFEFKTEIDEEARRHMFGRASAR